MKTGRWVLRAAVLAVGLVVLGPVAASVGWFDPLVGLTAFAAGVGVAVLGLMYTPVAVLRTRGRYRARRHLRHAIMINTGVVLAGAAFAWPAWRVPPINDITTDPADPPVLPLLAHPDGPRGYQRETFAPRQREAYPDIVPLRLPLGPDSAFALARHTARGQGWSVEAFDRRRRMFRATDKTLLFRFVDDIAVRVRPDSGGAVIDIRSRSRVGRSDLGLNAQRIRRFVASMRRMVEDADTIRP